MCSTFCIKPSQRGLSQFVHSVSAFFDKERNVQTLVLSDAGEQLVDGGNRVIEGMKPLPDVARFSRHNYIEANILPA